MPKTLWRPESPEFHATTWSALEACVDPLKLVVKVAVMPPACARVSDVVAVWVGTTVRLGVVAVGVWLKVTQPLLVAVTV